MIIKKNWKCESDGIIIVKCIQGGAQMSDELDIRFKYHAPKEGQLQKFIEIREKAKELAELIESHVPDSRERATAIAKVEESVMWANAGIARRSYL